MAALFHVKQERGCISGSPLFFSGALVQEFKTSMQFSESCRSEFACASMPL